MSDPVNIKDAADATVGIAADDVPGFGRVQVVKLLLGADGASNGLAGAGNAIPVSESATVLIGAAAQTAIVNNILSDPPSAAATDTTNVRSMTVQVVSTATGGTFIFEQSNDNASWQPLPVFNAALGSPVPIVAAITATASQIVYTIPVRCRFVRLRIVTTITGGSIQAFTRASSDPWTPGVFTVAQPNGANLQTTVTGLPAAAASADALANPTVTKLDALGALFNGTTWDRARNNTAITLETSAARTTTATGTTITNFNARGLLLFVNVTAIGGTPTLVVRLQAQDPVSLNWVDIPGAATATISTVSTTMLTMYPGAPATANVSVNGPLPRVFRAAWVIGGGTPSLTFSVGAQLIL